MGAGSKVSTPESSFSWCIIGGALLQTWRNRSTQNVTTNKALWRGTFCCAAHYLYVNLLFWANRVISWKDVGSIFMLQWCAQVDSDLSPAFCFSCTHSTHVIALKSKLTTYHLIWMDRKCPRGHRRTWTTPCGHCTSWWATPRTWLRPRLCRSGSGSPSPTALTGNSVR